MGFIVELPFTFPHGKLIKVIFSDQYEDNYVSPSLAARLSRLYEARSSCYYKGDYFIVQFKLGEFIGGAKCYLDKRLLEDHPVILCRT